MSELAQALKDIARVPLHLVLVIFALVIAIGNDRTAACFALGAAVMGLFWGLAAVGAVLVLYGVLIFLAEIVRAIRLTR